MLDVAILIDADDVALAIGALANKRAEEILTPFFIESGNFPGHQERGVGGGVRDQLVRRELGALTPLHPFRALRLCVCDLDHREVRPKSRTISARVSAVTEGFFSKSASFCFKSGSTTSWSAFW